MDTFVNLAKENALKSNQKYRHGCVVIKKKQLYFGYNQETHQTKGFNNKTTIHAEIDACKKVPKNVLKGAVVIIVRVNNQGKLCPSFPCETCKKYLESMKVKSVYFS